MAKNKSNSKDKSKKIKLTLIHVLILISFLATFFAYLFMKFTSPTMIVGGKSNKVQNDYKVQITESVDAKAEKYRAIFTNGGNNCGSNAPLGLPTLSYDVVKKSALICNFKYTTQFNTQSKTPIWVAHVLKKSDFQNANYTERTNDFREDKNLKQYSPKPSDYTRSGFDRGHLAPAADFSYSEKAMSESFIMTNIAPQNPQLNRGMWADLEKSTRGLLKYKDINDIYVVTGTLYYKNTSLGEFNGIQIPTHFYKVIIEPQHGYSAAYLIPNDGSAVNHFSQYLIKIRDLEKVAKIDFNPQLSSESANEMEVGKNAGVLNKYLSQVNN